MPWNLGSGFLAQLRSLARFQSRESGTGRITVETSLPVSNGLHREMKPTHAIAIAVVILAGVVAVSAQNRHFGLPFLVTIGDKYGFMDTNCHMVIPAQYAEAMQFSEGLAAVKIGGKWGYIDERGSLVIPPEFAGAWFFSDGLASVKLDERSPLWGSSTKTESS